MTPKLENFFISTYKHASNMQLQNFKTDNMGTNVSTRVVYVPMLTPGEAVELYLGDLARRSRSDGQRTVQTYKWHLYKFLDLYRGSVDVTEITSDDCRRHLDRWNHCAQGTRDHAYTVLNAFLEWLVYPQERIAANPIRKVQRPGRMRSEDLDVTTIATVDVPKLLAACETWPERITISILAYMGPRRHAVALLRVRDYNGLHQTMRFREKGGKTIWKPVPGELAPMLDHAINSGVIHTQWNLKGPDAYLIAPEASLRRGGVRDDRVIWRLVKRVAERAGVEAHVHALRASFAVFYLESHPGDTDGLQELMGHRNAETTKTYLRKLDRSRVMEPVRTLSWASVSGTTFESLPAMGAGGFEPPFSAPGLEWWQGTPTERMH